MTDDQDLRHVVRLAGVEVTFRGPMEEGRKPPPRPQRQGRSHPWRPGFLRALPAPPLAHGVQTGVEAGVFRREHLRAIQAAVGGDNPEKHLFGDEKINGRVAAYVSSRDEIAAVWWVYAHEAEAARGSLEILGAILGGLAELPGEKSDELVLSALLRSLDEAGMVRA